MKYIDLSKYREPGIGLYSGNQRGAAVRDDVGLDNWDRQREHVTVKIPDDVFAVTASFLSGLFAKSIRRVGEEAFRERYTFVGKNIDDTLEAVIRYASKHRGAI